MANIAVTTADRAEIVAMWEPLHFIAGEAISACAPMRVDGTTGLAMNGNGTDATEAAVVAIATRSVAAGEPITGMKKGILGGLTFSQAYNALIYVSDTDARLGDAAGTVTKIVGRVTPAHAVTLGMAPDKLLCVDL